MPGDNSVIGGDNGGNGSSYVATCVVCGTPLLPNGDCINGHAQNSGGGNSGGSGNSGDSGNSGSGSNKLCEVCNSAVLNDDGICPNCGYGNYEESPLIFYKEPDLFSLSEDPILFTVVGNNVITEGTHGELYIQLLETNIADYPIEVGTKLEITINKVGSYMYEWVNSITGDNQILHYSNFDNDKDYLNHALSVFEKNWELRRYFDMSVYISDQIISVGGINLKSKKFGTVNVDKCVAEMIRPDNVRYELSNPTSEVPEVTKRNYKLGIRVYDEDYNIIGEDIAPTYNTNKVTFNISDFLSHLPNPHFERNNMVENITDACKPYRIVAFELYNGKEQAHKQSNIYYVLFGKSSHIKLGEYHEEINSFYNEVKLHSKFLTLQPRTKRITPKAPEMLSYLVHQNNVTQVKCYADKTYKSGAKQTVLISTTDVNISNVLIFNIDKMDIYSNNGQVSHFSFYLKDQNDMAISEIRNFVFDYNSYDYLRYFIAKNSYGGGFDCMRSTGMVKKNDVKMVKQFANYMLPYDYIRKDFKKMQVSAERTISFTLDWGLLSRYGGNSRAWKNFIQQIELSEQVWEFINNLYIPCLFTTKKYELHTDDKLYYTHISNYERAFIDNAYSDDDIPIVGDYSDDFNNDFFS